MADVAPVANTNSKFHEQAPSPEDPEIRRQAEEIIRSLNTNSSETALGVSPEIPAPPETIQQETSAIEQTIQRSFEQQPKAAVEPEPAAPPVVIPDLGNIQSALRKAQDEHGYRDNSQSSDTASDGQIPVQLTNDDSVQQEQEVLNEIQEQSAMVAGVVPAPSNDDTTARQDDRDILNVDQNKVAAAAATEAEESPMPAWSQQEPSQGEAARVDYQRLFDQLRNVQGNQE